MVGSMYGYKLNRRGLAALLLGLFTAATLPIAWASTARIESLSIQEGTLIVTGSKALPAPQMESHPGASGNQPTELVILQFATEGDAKALQKLGSQILISHPMFKQFWVNGGQDGIPVELVLEVQIPPNTKSAPMLSKRSDTEWQVIFQPQPSAQQATQNETPFKNMLSATTQSTSKTKISEKPVSTKIHMIERGQPGDSRTEIESLTTDLQNVIHERDELEQTVQRLQAELTQKNRLQNNLKHPTDLSELEGGWIRDNNPADSRFAQEANIITNQRKALYTLTKKLKATEAALARQTQKTRELATALADIKQDPAILKDPELVATVDEAGIKVKPDEIKPNQVLAKEKVEQETENKKKFAYQPKATPKPTPPPTVSRTVYNPNEIKLKIAVRENPTNAANSLQLADLYVAKNDLSRAESVLTQLLSHNPACSDAYYYLALIYVGQKRGLEAQAALDTYKRLNPGDRERIRSAQQAIESTLSRKQSFAR